MAELLRVQNLQIGRADKIFCDDLSFSIARGECWGVLGINGRGKTTLIHTMAGLLRPQQGKIFFNHKDIFLLSRKDLAQGIGVLLQEEHCLFPILVEEMVKFGRHCRPHTQDCAENWSDIISKMQLTHLLQRNFLSLSGGEQKRVSIARILFQNPTLFFLDEPTSHLDPAMQQMVLQHFRSLCNKGSHAVLFSTHDLNLVEQFCDHVVLFFEHGKVRVGAKRDLLTEDNLATLYGCRWSKLLDKVWSIAD